MVKKHLVPLPASMMLISILGLLASLLWLWDVDKDMSVAFTILFAAMFFACLFTMKNAPVIHGFDRK